MDRAQRTDGDLDLTGRIIGVPHGIDPILLRDRDWFVRTGDLPLDPQLQQLTLGADGFEDRLSRHAGFGRDRVDRGREFAFRTIPTWLKRDSTLWTYRFREVAAGTEVTESYEVVKLPPRPILAVIRRLLPHHLDMRPHMQRTLEALKHSAEAGPRGGEASAARSTAPTRPAG